ncbi:uncharacterized protein LOC141719534 [Apium graveolens]|uniref:uncharacterized protein LOC141719534 n=1 Tax=Apium graveolens TaxID=4045 RepID=UPI003D7B3B67
MECYVDDMIVKSLFLDHAEDLRECFKTLRKNNMKINPKKCMFGVASGKFLGYLVPSAEKFAYGLVMATQKLRHYFQGRILQIVTDQPLKKILTRPEASGRVVSWSIELGEYDLEYTLRTSIKSLALADFMVDYTFSEQKDLMPEEQLMRQPGRWKRFLDGSVAGLKCEAGLILSCPDGFKIFQAIRFAFPLTNNEIEYKALLDGLSMAKSLEVKHLWVFSDSMLVVKYFSGEYEQREPRTRAYTVKVKELSLSFQSFELSQITRENNSRADALSRLASAETQKIVHGNALSDNVDDADFGLLKKGTLPLGKKEAQKVRYKAASYTIINERLYRRSASSPLLQCLVMEEQKLARETVHESICKEHLAGRALSFKILRQGFYWPTLTDDAH